MFRDYGNLLAFLFDTHDLPALRLQLSENFGRQTARLKGASVQGLVSLELTDRQARYETEMPKIVGNYSITEFHGGYANQQVGERKVHTFGLILSMNLPSAKGNRNRDLLNG
jgi:hypothetical protein